MKIVFMGTPEIAAHALDVLLQSGREIVGVYTREDKPVGRKQVLTPPPVKLLAEKHGIPVFQPKTMKTTEAVEQLATLQPDLVVVVAYGRILPTAVLETPALGCINLHVSLLPHYRGAAPVQWAVINGEERTGISIMQLDEGLDTGPLLAVEEVLIDQNETAGELLERVGTQGAVLLQETITKIQAGTITATAQQGEASLAPPLNKKMAFLDLARDAKNLHNLVRGCNPWPLAWMMVDAKRVKVLRTVAANGNGKVGEILSLRPLEVATGQGSLILDNVVPEGARAMSGTDFAAGRRFAIGEVLNLSNTPTT